MRHIISQGLAIRLWELAAVQDNSFPTVHRNLALAYYNKLQDPKRALHELEKAFSLDETDARIFLELDQLYRKTGKSEKERLAWYECHKELIGKRDDLYTEYITLLNMDGQYENAYECIMGHNFHLWEGGEIILQTFGL